MSTWNQRKALMRLQHVAANVPAPAGQGTQTATIRGFVAYSYDARITIELTRLVLHACAVRRPRSNEDDGYCDEVREDAIRALDWADRWILLRESQFWDCKHLYDFLDGRVK